MLCRAYFEVQRMQLQLKVVQLLLNNKKQKQWIEKILLDSIRRKSYLESIIDTSKFKIISGPLHLLALTPINYTSSQAYKWSIKTRNSLLANNFMLSRPMYGDRYYLKAVMGNPNTKFEDLNLLANLINHSIT